MSGEKFNIQELRNITVLPDELVNALTYHKGILPMKLFGFTNLKEYDKFIKEEGIEDEVWAEYNKIRLAHKTAKDDDEFMNNQLEKWLEENPEFNELLIDAVKKSYDQGAQ